MGESESPTFLPAFGLFSPYWVALSSHNMKAFTLFSLFYFVTFGGCLLVACFFFSKVKREEMDLGEKRGGGISEEWREGKLWSGCIA